TVTSDYDFNDLSDGCGQTGSLTVTYTITDDCGNDVTLEGTFTIEDTTNPVVSGCNEALLDYNYECVGVSDYETIADIWDAANIAYLEGCATDACGEVTVTSDYDFNDLSDGCGQTGSLTVTYTITDDCGNDVTLEGTFTIEDTTNPVVSGCNEALLDYNYECVGVSDYETIADSWDAANIAY